MEDNDFSYDFCDLIKSIKLNAAAASLLRAILPEGLLDYFDLVNIEQGKDQHLISLEEYNLLST